jgi:16S rRNA processing protein RimM
VTPELILFGTLGRAHGLGGEIALRPFNADGEDLARASLPLRVRLVQGPSSRDLTVVKIRPAAGNLLVRLEGIESREQAAALTNGELWVPRDCLPAPAGDEFYVEDLIGCEVVDLAGQVRGTVRSAFWNGAQDVLTVWSEGGGELLVPVVAEFVRAVDLEARRLVVDPHE